jgi:zinc protease
MKRLLLTMLMVFAFAPAAFAAKAKELEVQAIKSPSGVEAWLVEDHTVPVISMGFSFEGGDAYDPESKPGVSHLVSTLLDEGAGDLTSQEFQGKEEDNEIGLSFVAGRDAFYGNLMTLSSTRELAFGLLGLALSKPRFDADAIERMKNAATAEIKQNMGDPAWLVARTFNGMVYEGHYYSRPGLGTPESVEAVTRKDLVDFVQAQFGRNVLKVAIAGDVTKAQAEGLIERAFGALPEKAQPVTQPDAQMHYAGKTILLPLDTPQTYIAAGEPGIRRKDKDWHAAMVMNYILGGSSFDARLMTEIREKRGLTYGVYSQLTSMTYGATLQADMSASNDKVEEALRLLKDAWSGMAKDGPTEEELANAKSYLTGSLPLKLTSTSEIAQLLNEYQRDDLGPDYVNKENSFIEALSMDDVKREARKLLKADQLAVVLVGKPKNINVDILLDKPPGLATWKVK